MNVLIIGSGGREHAISWKISQNTSVDNIYVAPGNGGTGRMFTNVDIGATEFQKLGRFAIENDVSMVIVGPEVPLVNGIVDFFHSSDEFRGIRIIGPDRDGAMLEGSKAFAKVFMEEFNIPTAKYKSFTIESKSEVADYLDSMQMPIVVKADGLAAGKGVIICQTREEADASIEEMFNGKFGSAGGTVVVEEFLDGIEFSVFALTDGKDYVLLPMAKDYKRIGENDTGLNTGGMGAISPVPFLNDALLDKVNERIIRPTIDGIHSRGYNYKGFVFFGLINVEGNPYVIEYNCRMGDPETQVVMPRLKTDLVELLDSLFNGTLSNHQVEMNPEYTSAVILTSGGYPGHYEKNKNIEVEVFPEAMYFEAGTKITNGRLVTSGGRVMACIGQRRTLADAIELAYAQADKIDFEGKYCRRDIGRDLLKYV